MDKLTILDEIRKSDDLLSMPQAISELIREMEKPNFSAETLSKIILKDASLTGRILKLANSPYYHRLTDIRDVSHAIQVLGSTTVKCLALSSSVFQPSLIESTSGVNVKNFFSSILNVAACSQSIAQEVQYKAPDEAFIAGLLHHIGIMFFLHHYPGEYSDVVLGSCKSANLIDAEIKRFGVDHSEVGYQLAVRWNLPQPICEAIKDHHNFSRDVGDGKIQTVLRLAVLMTDDGVSAYRADLESRVTQRNELAKTLGISIGRIEELTTTLTSETIRVAEYLDVDIGNIEEMLTRANQEIWKTYLMVENLFRERQELSAKLLKEERDKGAVMSKNIAIATLSHYVNNAVMAIYGRAEIMRRQQESDQTEKLLQDLPRTLEVTRRMVKKIIAVLCEIKEISPIDEVKFYNMSQAMNLDERIEERMAKFDGESGLVIPIEELESTS